MVDQSVLKIKILKKRKRADKHDDPNMKECVPEETQNKTNQERKSWSLLIMSWNRNEIKNMHEIFSYSVACEIINGNEDHEPKSVTKCQNRHNWTKWKDVVQAELNSLNKRKVFGPIVLKLEAVRPVGYK